MKQDPQFTAHLQEWLNTPDEKKDWDEGAILLLQLSGNKIMYHNISVNPKGKAEFIKGQLQKYLNFRLQQLTHEQVEEMQAKVESIVKKVIKPDATVPDGSPSDKSAEFADFKAGKRADHDTLPDEIKVLYAENLDIVHRMRELHLKLRSLSLADATCPDSERYPFLKEIIALDKKLHENWDAYDHYVAGATVTAGDGSAAAPTEEPTDTALEEAETVASVSTCSPAEAAETVEVPAPEATAKKTTRKASSKKTADKKA
jgi:hypothetical protein